MTDGEVALAMLGSFFVACRRTSRSDPGESFRKWNRRAGERRRPFRDRGTRGRRWLDALALAVAGEHGVGDASRVLAVRSGHAAPHLNVVKRYGEGGAGPDQLTSFGGECLRYDAAGRLVEDRRRRLAWDAKGRLARMDTMEGTTEHTYGHGDARYGDKLGPTIEWLRSQGKSWDQIIESAVRTGGKDLGL